jgi:AcrR family transcriptional regulator
MRAIRTARERARAELTREIKDEARRQLAGVGADGLSLRAVARELGMVSSALYRYFPSRDDLLTALIVDAYEALATAAESADRPGEEPRRRLRAVCTAVRAWARANPHEYALIYGSPVPGYSAPRITVESAARIPLALLQIVRAGWAAGALPPPQQSPQKPQQQSPPQQQQSPPQKPPQQPPQSPPPSSTSLSPVLAAQMRAVADRFAPELPEHALAGALLAWTQLFGLISFELFGQLVGSADPSDDLFAYAVERMADQIGLR